MRACVSCGRTDRPPSPALPQMCGRCYWNLPAATRAAYQHGTIGIKQIARASRDSQQSVRKFGGGRRVLALVIAWVVASGCGTREEKVTSTAAEPTSYTTTATDYTATDSDLDRLPSTHPPTITDADTDADAEFEHERRFAETFERAARQTATDTTQPLHRAPVHVVHFAAPALPTPILDERRRECIAYNLTASFSRVRYNLLLQPNLYDATIRNWSDPKWLATFRVEGGTFPVNLWRVRAGVPTFWRTVRVQAGPGLPTGNPQVGLSPDFFRGGDALCVEAARTGGAVFVAYDPQTGLVVQPQLSVIQNVSNDSTPMPGAWMVISGEVKR